ncbi:MAG TPA: hypothetical protein VNO30_34495, partial [Kofleriaceae bacterium]|nr:hypothetical protein [Kofleriaceae bacterium]
PFPLLVVISPGKPATVLDAYGCEWGSPGVYHADWGLALHVVVLAELPTTSETLLLRLLGRGPVFTQALAELARLPGDAWERSVATPLLVHFRLDSYAHPPHKEDTVSAEIQAWFEDYQRKMRKEVECNMLLRMLRSRFGELAAADVARIEAADGAELERWSERILRARTLAEMFDDPV